MPAHPRSRHLAAAALAAALTLTACADDERGDEPIEEPEVGGEVEGREAEGELEEDD